MKTPVQELMEYMEQNQYFIGNDLLAKYKELIEKEKIQSTISLLPNDEDISLYAKKKYPHKKSEKGSYYEGKSKGYAEGAKWMKWKLKNTTKR